MNLIVLPQLATQRWNYFQHETFNEWKVIF